MSTSSSSGFSLGRVLVIVIPIAAIAAAIVGYTYMTGAGSGGLGGISVVEVKYKLMFRDKPLADALVMAYSQDRPGVVGLGTSDKDGVVVLETDNGEGRMMPGLVSGKHKLTVRGAMPSAMGGPTRVYTPATYDDPSKTTLSVEVKSGGGGEPVALVIEDDGTGMSEEEIAEGMESYRKQLEALPEMQKMRSGPGGGGPGGGGPGAGGPGGGAGRPERPEGEAPATEGSAPAEGAAETGSAPAEVPAEGSGQS